MNDRTPRHTPSFAPSWLPALNKSLTNRIQGVWAPYLPPWAVVVHTGRRSGRTYETPVISLRHGGKVAIALAYGSRTDWIRNIFAEGGGQLRQRGHTLDLRNPRVVTDPADDSLPRTMRLIAKRGVGVLVAEVYTAPN